MSPAENSVISSHPNRKANAVEAVTTSAMESRKSGSSVPSQSAFGAL